MTRRQLALAAVVAITVGIIVWLLTGGAGKGGDAPRAGATADAGAAGQGGGGARAGKKRVEPPTGEPDPAGALRLEGQVIDEAQQPVAGATVLVTSNPIRTAITEGDGSFVFEGLLPRHYQVMATRDGDRADAVEVRLRADTEPVILRMHRGITLAIRVLAADTGAPIEGAMVTAGGWTERDVLTDATGVAEIPGLGSWFNYVTVEADGYAPSANGYTLPDDPGGRIERTIRLTRGAEVRGTVLDPRGQPVAGAYVAAARADGSASTETLSDDHGSWRFPVLGAGSYTFVAAVDGHPPAQQSVDLDGTTPTDGVVLRLEIGAQVSGAVVDDAGAPVPNARVVVVVGYEPTVRSAGADGRFAVDGLGRGVFTLFASQGDRASEPIRVDVSKSDVADLTVTIVDATISGVVVDPSGEPVAEAAVDAMPVGGFLGDGLANRAVTDSAGQFTLGPLSVGSYEIGAVWPDTPQDNRYFRPKPATVKTGMRDVRIVLPAAGTIRGRVTLGGQPVTRYGVAISDFEAGMASFATPQVAASADGAFERKGMPPGTFVVGIGGDGFARKVLRDVVVEAGKVTDLGTIQVEPGREVRGRVVDADGAAVAGATVATGRFFHPREGGLGLDDDPFKAAIKEQRSTETGSDGAFVLRGVGTSERRGLKIIADHPVRGRSREIKLPEGDAEVVLTLERVGSIAGIVTGASAGERMMVKAEAGGDSVGSAHTTSGMRFQIDGIPAGKVTVRADIIPNRTSPPVEVTVEAGKVTEVTIVFPTGDVTLEVRTGDCIFVMLLPPGPIPDGDHWNTALATAQCDKEDHVTELRDVAAGDYNVCLNETCKPVTITASPKVQKLDARRWK